MYSSEDLERFYFQYQTEALPHGESLQSFCVKHKVPYNIFQKWLKDIRKKIVEVQINGVPEIGHEEKSKTSDQSHPILQSKNDTPVRIWVDIRISNGLYLSQKEFKLPGFGSYGRAVGGVMLSVTGLNHFYYVRDFTDMRCKHSRVLSVIRERLHREPNDGDVFIVMSRNRRIVRMFSFDNRSYSLFEKKFVAGYQFMKVERNGADTVYRIAWKDVVLILENPIVKTLKIR